MSFNENQKKVRNELFNLDNDNLYKLISTKLHIELEFNDSNFNDEDKYVICTAIATDYSVEQIEKELHSMNIKQ